MHEIKVHVRLLDKSSKGASAAVTLYSMEGELLASIGEIAVRRWSDGRRYSSTSHVLQESLLYETELVECKKQGSGELREGRWLVSGGLEVNDASNIKGLLDQAGVKEPASFVGRGTAILHNTVKKGPWRGIVHVGEGREGQGIFDVDGIVEEAVTLIQALQEVRKEHPEVPLLRVYLVSHVDGSEARELRMRDIVDGGQDL